MLLFRDEGQKIWPPLLRQGIVLASGGPMHLSLLNRLNMVKIELLMPLAYFGIVRTSSTETVKIAGFFLLIVPNA